MASLKIGTQIYDASTNRIGKVVACSKINDNCVIVAFDDRTELINSKRITSLEASSEIDTTELGTHLAKLLKDDFLRDRIATILDLDGRVYGIQWIPNTSNFEVLYKTKGQYKAHKINKSSAKDILLRIEQ